MSVITQFIIVFGVGMVELWAAIPTGFIIGLDPLAIGIAAISGEIAGALIVATLGERLRRFLEQKYPSLLATGKQGAVYRIWQKYGVAGMGLLSPIVTGAPLGALLGIVFGAPKKRLLLWLIPGVILWGVGLTLAGVLGLSIFEGITG